MKYFDFTIEEKAELFDIISEHFYKRNFGQMSKSDIDLMMFHFYIQKLERTCLADDGTIDYAKCSDYKVSRELGITQQRVRNLKIRDRLVYPADELAWEASFVKLIENARYDKRTGKVVLNIPDPNLYIEIQNFIEEQGAHVEKQLNSKVLQIRAEYFIDLIVALETEKTRKEIVKNLKKQFKDNGQNENFFDERNIGKSLLDATVNITTVAANLSSVISPQNKIGIALLRMLSNVK